MLALSALLILHDNWTYRSSFRLRSYLFSEGHIDPERPQKVGWPESTAAPSLSQESTILGGEALRAFRMATGAATSSAKNLNERVRETLSKATSLTGH